MEFMPMRTLSREPQTILSQLQRDGELVVTNNGQPIIFMIDLTGRDLVEVVNIFRYNKSESLQIKTKSEIQRLSFEKFFAAINAIDDEIINDDDMANLDNSRVNFNRGLDL